MADENAYNELVKELRRTSVISEEFKTLIIRLANRAMEQAFDRGVRRGIEENEIVTNQRIEEVRREVTEAARKTGRVRRTA